MDAMRCDILPAESRSKPKPKPKPKPKTRTRVRAKGSANPPAQTKNQTQSKTYPTEHQHPRPTGQMSRYIHISFILRPSLTTTSRPPHPSTFQPSPLMHHTCTSQLISLPSFLSAQQSDLHWLLCSGNISSVVQFSNNNGAYVWNGGLLAEPGNIRHEYEYEHEYFLGRWTFLFLDVPGLEDLALMW
ncbi:uncharacterized protein BO95DRAFT_295055 [Aspergillus brunneoviolaceus CBS 621.78]|uniref:Uncharacterized protein n=1 Tax=Aspergillus brunneoviolaceus CBS 621.78 TaxID=1450534 RepID=A0ACD1FUR3_9EURO|nr:hypothetical protein BO95DRAFT_295055 [Aspergillus brunneoviolaceus CBS 621.78]RAH40666.1 hypothetical protein BO95DRAFT_295055 [Aspergillus brunneoviolaceus CBS 621.78]